MSQTFIDSIAPAAQSDMAASGILASVTIAQACLESAYGTSELAVQACNLFGMKAVLSGNAWASEWDGSTYSKDTKEQAASGTEYTVTADFRKYASWAASIKDHSDYLTGAKNGSVLRYAGLSGCADYRAAAQLIKDGGYATDAAYVDKICAVIEDSNLTQYDGGSSMEIKEALLTISNYNRPGTKRARTTGVACHYIGNPGTSAQANRNYFENLSTTKATKASCHFIIGLQGEIFQLIPEDEISWCTNQANSSTISIEACHPDSTGKFSAATYQTYVELCADLCTRWHLDPIAGGLIRHYDVTGKCCPKYFVDNKDAWEQFQWDVLHQMEKVTAVGWIQDNTGWWYRYEDGSYPFNIWLEIDGKWYWFDGAGYAVENAWYDYDGKWYYLGPDGAMATGLQVIDGKAYYFHDNGSMSAAGEKVTLESDADGALK